MNAKIMQTNGTSQKSRAVALGIMAMLALCMFGLAYTAHADIIAAQASVGSSGQNVSNIQSFLATNSAIYPQGIVSGYYGALTKAAVQQFQIDYNIPPVGNVGPLTLAKMNSVISSGLGLDVSAPVIQNLVVSAVTSNSATITWNTDTYAQGKVFYDTQPLQLTEADIPFAAPGVSGSVVQNTALTNTVQNMTLSNLEPNTTYYYTVESIDASGNVSLTWPATFQTN